jgi:hypothetical protein
MNRHLASAPMRERHQVTASSVKNLAVQFDGSVRSRNLTHCVKIKFSAACWAAMNFQILGALMKIADRRQSPRERL